jgi:hypothetical protein
MAKALRMRVSNPTREDSIMAEKIYRVNMTTLGTSSEDVPAQWKGLGGRALTSTIVA